MKINTIIVDDNLEELNLLKELCLKIDNINLVNQFNSPISAINWLQNNKVNLIISDIEMPDLNGIEMVKHLKNKPDIIFTSNHPEFALKSFEVQPIHYLTKPITLTDLLSSLDRLKNTIETNKEINYIYINQNQEHIKLILNDIFHVKSEGNFVTVFCEDKKFLVLSNLTQFIKQLPNSQFTRIHKSYAINLNHIDKFTFEHVIINSEIIPIGEFYRSDFLEIMNTFSIKRNG
jgi:two-component system response regulator LytT